MFILACIAFAEEPGLPQLQETPAPTAAPACQHVFDVFNDFTTHTIPLYDDPAMCYMELTVRRQKCVFCGEYNYETSFELFPHVGGKACPNCQKTTSPYRVLPMPVDPVA